MASETTMTITVEVREMLTPARRSVIQRALSDLANAIADPGEARVELIERRPVGSV